MTTSGTLTVYTDRPNRFGDLTWFVTDTVGDILDGGSFPSATDENGTLANLVDVLDANGWMLSAPTLTATTFTATVYHD